MKEPFFGVDFILSFIIFLMNSQFSMFTSKATIKDCVSNGTGMSDDKERACRVVWTLIIFNYMWMLSLIVISHSPLNFVNYATPSNNDTIIIIIVVNINNNIIIIMMAVVHIWMPDLKKKKKTTTTARRITVASSVYKFTKDILFKILHMNLLKIL